MFRGLYNISAFELDDVILGHHSDRVDALATILLLRLYLSRQSVGTVPVTLDGIDDGIVDLWTLKRFQWYPSGVSNDLSLRGVPLVKAGTPFLLSPGRAGLRVIDQNQYRTDDSGDEPDGDYVRFVLTQGDVMASGLRDATLWQLKQAMPEPESR